MISRGNLVFMAGVIAVIVAVILGYWFILGPSDTKHPATTAPATSAEVDHLSAARIVRADGSVEMRLGSGEWQSVGQETEVGPDTDVRTGLDGNAALTYGKAFDVQITPDSQVRLASLGKHHAKFVVKDGLVIADVKPESAKVVRIGVAQSDALAEAQDGRLHVMTDGKGHVQAAVTRGQAKVTAQGRTVDIPAGYTTAIHPGKPPQTPMVLPTSLLLKIKWPQRGKTSKSRQLIVGTTTPSSRVRIGNTVVTADRRGRFRAVVELQEGKNELHVRVLDVVGRVESAVSPPIELDTRGPKHAIQTDPQMWKR